MDCVWAVPLTVTLPLTAARKEPALVSLGVIVTM